MGCCQNFNPPPKDVEYSFQNSASLQKKDIFHQNESPKKNVNNIQQEYQGNYKVTITKNQALSQVSQQQVLVQASLGSQQENKVIGVSTSSVVFRNEAEFNSSQPSLNKTEDIITEIDIEEQELFVHNTVQPDINRINRFLELLNQENQEDIFDARQVLIILIIEKFLGMIIFNQEEFQKIKAPQTHNL